MIASEKEKVIVRFLLTAIDLLRLKMSNDSHYGEMPVDLTQRQGRTVS